MVMKNENKTLLKESKFEEMETSQRKVLLQRDSTGFVRLKLRQQKFSKTNEKLESKLRTKDPVVQISMFNFLQILPFF